MKLAGIARGGAARIGKVAAALLPLLLAACALLDQPRPDPAVATWYTRWAIPYFPVAVGLVFQAITLLVIFAFIRDCIRKGNYSRMSGFPLAGPIFIDFGLWLSPSDFTAPGYLVPWLVEFLATGIAIAVRRKTRATPA